MPKKKKKKRTLEIQQSKQTFLSVSLMRTGLRAATTFFCFGGVLATILEITITPGGSQNFIRLTLITDAHYLSKSFSLWHSHGLFQRLAPKCKVKETEYRRLKHMNWLNSPVCFNGRVYILSKRRQRLHYWTPFFFYNNHQSIGCFQLKRFLIRLSPFRPACYLF